MTFAPHARRIYADAFRVTWGFESFGPLARAPSPHAVRVPRAGALLTASFRPRLAAPALAVRLGVPVTKAPRGLAPPSHRAMPGTPKKSRRGVALRPFGYRLLKFSASRYSIDAYSFTSYSASITSSSF